MCDLVWVKIASIIVMQFFSPLLVIERWLSKKKKNTSYGKVTSKCIVKKKLFLED